jgi:hypothetical protein
LALSVVKISQRLIGWVSLNFDFKVENATNKNAEGKIFYGSTAKKHFLKNLLVHRL